MESTLALVCVWSLTWFLTRATFLQSWALSSYGVISCIFLSEHTRQKWLYGKQQHTLPAYKAGRHFSGWMCQVRQSDSRSSCCHMIRRILPIAKDFTTIANEKITPFLTHWSSARVTQSVLMNKEREYTDILCGKEYLRTPDITWGMTSVA